MAQRVDLHVGTPKSGTTFLQSALWTNREELRARGVLFPGKKLFDHNRASLQVRSGAHLHPGRPAGAWRSFCRQAAEYDGQVVLSNEWWLAANRRQARAAVEQIGGASGSGAAEVHVVITTRSPVLTVPAAWQESLKVGRGTSLPDFVAGLDADGKWTWAVLDPALVARQWAGIVGPERVHVVTTPPAGGRPDLLWHRFAQAVGFSPDGLELPPAVNESLSVQGARLLQEFGPALLEQVQRTDPSSDAQARWLRNTLVRKVLTRIEGDPIGVGPELRERLLQRGAESVRQLRELGCQVSGDLDEVAQGEDRPGARHPDSVTDAELVAAARALSVGQLRLQMKGGARGGAKRPDTAKSDAGKPARTPGERTRRWTFLVPSAYAAGGIARTVSITANALVERGHEVTVITLSRSFPEPRFPFDPRVRLVPLEDRYNPDDPDRPHPHARNDPRMRRKVRRLDRRPSRLVEDEGARHTFSAYIDQLLEKELRALPPGVVVTTRPEFGIAATLWAHPDSILVHQEHLSFLPRPERLRDALRRIATGADGRRRLDALLTLTKPDLRRWRRYVQDPSLTMAAIPNPTPFSVGEPAPLTNPVVIAAGRLKPQKGFERLIEAYAPLARSHPDWQLRIYGYGEQRDRLAEMIATSDVGDRIVLAGVSRQFEQELANASVYAMSSRYEGLPMVLLEALSKGVPPVSFDCPEGPRQLIDSGTNGVLVPQGDIEALTEALRSLMDDPARRRTLGAAAMETARQFEASAVVDRWVELVEEIDAART